MTKLRPVKRNVRDGWAWCDVCGEPEFLDRHYKLGTAFPCLQAGCSGKLTTKPLEPVTRREG